MVNIEPVRSIHIDLGSRGCTWTRCVGIRRDVRVSEHDFATTRYDEVVIVRISVVRAQLRRAESDDPVLGSDHYPRHRGGADRPWSTAENAAECETELRLPDAYLHRARRDTVDAAWWGGLDRHEVRRAAQLAAAGWVAIASSGGTPQLVL